MAKLLEYPDNSQIDSQAYESKISPLPESVRKWFTRKITEAFIKDTAAYFYDAEQREAMRDRLRTLLIPEKSPFVIVAHSQGSIIAYDVLCELENEDIEIPFFPDFRFTTRNSGSAGSSRSSVACTGNRQKVE